MMLKRRRYYPRVKILGGLYSIRREPKDDPMIREIKNAVNGMPTQRYPSGAQGTLVGSSDLVKGSDVRKP